MVYRNWFGYEKTAFAAQKPRSCWSLIFGKNNLFMARKQTEKPLKNEPILS
jgi:hypothetical protein